MFKHILIPTDGSDRNRVPEHFDAGDVRDRPFRRHQPFTQVLVNAWNCVRIRHAEPGRVRHPV